jgi:hypothetical protein
MTAQQPPADLVRAQLLLSVLDEGRRSSTYKLATLLGLFDCCVIGTDGAGEPPKTIGTDALAERVIDLYWRQVRPYEGGLLQQDSAGKAVIVRLVRALQLQTGARTASEARNTRGYAATARQVELTLVRMPLGKLQRPGGWTERSGVSYPRFLYEDQHFHEGVRERALPLDIPLQPGVARWLLGMTGLLRPLVELHWTRSVAAFNRAEVTEDRLGSFLFGAERRALAGVREGLRDLQGGRCFYCGLSLSTAGQVDHFVPWSRVPNDDLANLVLADAGCNGSKRDHYADLTLVTAWAGRPVERLTQVAASARWPLGHRQALSLARGLYAHLPPGQPLWQGPGRFGLLQTDEVLTVLPALTPHGR